MSPSPPAATSARSWRGSLRRWLLRRLVAFLNRPISRYERRCWNDLAALKRHARKGDVLLVEGDQRVSEVIKYLSQSSWSHSALYVGDELVRRGGELADRVRHQFGDEADHMVVEALMEGVVASPISKYVDYNIRLVRPHALRSDDLRVILDDAIGAIGWRYDLRNVLDLCVRLLPRSFVPVRLRRLLRDRLGLSAPTLGSGVTTRVICSSLLGQLFHRVRFPVLPTVTFPEGEDTETRARHIWPSWRIRRLLGAGPRESHGVFRKRHPTLLTPRDFDLSPYFEVVKFNAIAEGRTDYRRFAWEEE